jgi:hypothetical protein
MACISAILSTPFLGAGFGGGGGGVVPATELPDTDRLPAPEIDGLGVPSGVWYVSFAS